MLRLIFFFALTLATPALLAQAPDLEFVAGDPADLKVTVDRKTSKKHPGLIAVRVANRGADWAEPIVFHIHLDVTEKVAKGRLRDARYYRGGYPFFGRAGRAIKPRGQETYLIPGVWGGIKLLPRVSVTVEHASFFRGPPPLKSPVRITGRQEVDYVDDFTQARSKVWQLSFENPSPRANNLIVLSTQGRGKKKRCGLSRVFIEAESKLKTGEEPNLQERNWHRRAPNSSSGLDLAKNSDLIDWSTIYPTDTLPARVALTRTWDARSRIVLAPNEALVGEAKATTATGTLRFTFSIRADGKIETNLDNAEGTDPQRVARTLHAMFAPLIFPDLDEALRGMYLEIFERHATKGMLIALRPLNPDKPAARARLLRLRDDAIVAKHNVVAVNPGEVSVYTHDEGPDGRWRPLTQRIESRVKLNSAPYINLRFAWTGWFESGHWPRRMEARFTRFGRSEDVTLKLEIQSLRREAKGEADAEASTSLSPKGPGVAALRRAWSKPYRYPDVAFDLKGSLDLRVTESSSMDWVNRNRVRGDLTLHAWRGHAGAFNCPQARLTFTPRDKLSPASARTIQDLLGARSTIYTRQDFAARAPFDLAFRGCTLGAPKKNRIPVDGHREIVAVTLKKGIPVALHLRGGESRHYRFARSRDGLVPKTTEWKRVSGPSSLITTTYTAVRPGLQVPTKIEIRDWFGADWGPEVYRYRFTSAREVEGER